MSRRPTQEDKQIEASATGRSLHTGRERKRIHSWLSPKCSVDVVRRPGEYGVFSTQSIQSNEIVAVWGGVIFTNEEIHSLGTVYPQAISHGLSVADGFTMSTTCFTCFDDAELFNHSCEPNLGIKSSILLLARRDIDEGEELTFDYDTCYLGPHSFDCNCGSPRCRKIIDGSGWQSEEFRVRHCGWFSWFIEQKIAALSQ